MTKPTDARLWIPAAVLAFTAALYLPALSFGFVIDDPQQIVWSRPHLTWRAVPSYFTTDVWSYITPVPSNYYRPVFMVWLMLTSTFCGVSPALWHLSAILLHLGATFLFYLLARRILSNGLFAAGVAAMLFGIHPVHVEAVAWVSGATEPLFAIFAFAALLCHLNWCDRVHPPQKFRWRAASLLLFALAVFVKETALVLPFVIAIYEWTFFPASNSVARLRNTAKAVLPYLAVFLFYFPLRLHALGSLTPMSRPWTWSTLAATLPFTVAFYIRQLLLPIQYSLFYPIAPVRTLSLTTFFLPLLLVAAIAAGLLRFARRSRDIAFAAALLILPILPVLNLRAFSFDDFLHDRYLYFPAAGLCLAIALVWMRTASRPRLRAAFSLAAVAALSIVTLRAAAGWKTNLAVTARGFEVAPGSNVAQIYYGQELARQNRCVEALPILKRALAGSLTTYTINNSIAHCYSQMAQYDEAAAYLRDVIVAMPKLPEPHLNLGAIDFQRGRLEEAEKHVRDALALRRHAGGSPMDDRYHFLLGGILEARGDLKGALAEIQAELRENPEADDVRDRALDLERRLRHVIIEK